MSCAYSTFSNNATIYNGGVLDDTQTIKLISGDQLQALKISLKQWSCKEVDGDTIPLKDWDDFDLRRLSAVTFYFKKYGVEDGQYLFEQECVIMDLKTGVVIMFFPIDSLDGLLGDYEGQIQITFDNNRIVTVSNKIYFNITKRFNDN